MNSIFDEEQEDLSLLSALVAQHLLPQQIPADHWEKIIELSISQGLGPMLYWAVKQSGIDVTGETVWQPLKQMTLRTSARHMMFEHAVKKVDANLSAAGIAALWLKGIVLARTVYPRPSLRPMGDLDVLIPVSQQALALNVAQSVGYQFMPHQSHLISNDDPLTMKLSHHYHLESSRSDGLILELHSRLLGNQDTVSSIKHLDWFWTQTEAVETGEFRFTGLRPEAHLLYLSAHAIIHHGEATTLLRQYFDVHRLITTFELDWNLVTEQAAVLGWTYAVNRTLTLAVRFFDTPVPPVVFEELKRCQADDENFIRSIRLKGKGGPWEIMRARLARLSQGEQITYLFRNVFPRGSYLRERYVIPEDRPVWPYYLYRWWNQLGVVGWWVWERLVMSLKGRRW